VDSLGATRVLQPSAAFIKLNARILQAGGVQIDVPPIGVAPEPIAGVTVEAAETGPAFTISWTSPEFAASECAAAWVAVYDGAGISYYKNLLKLVTVEQPGAAQELDIPTEVEDRFGPLTEGLVVKVEMERWDNTTGLTSPRAACETIVTA
jgi:hypothetical protein